MPELFPGMIATVGDVAYLYGYLLQWPIAWHGVAPQWNNDKSSIDGRFHRSNGMVQGTSVVKRQDTFIVGTASRTGRAFNANSGTWLSNAVDPQYDKYGLEQVDGTTSAPVAEVVSATTTPKIEHALLVLHRDFAATGGVPVAGWRTGYSSYLHLAYLSPDGLDYRISCESGQPIRIDFTKDNGATWSQVSLASKVGDSDSYLKNNRGEIRLKAVPDHDDVRFEVELGDGHFLRTATGPMPSTGNIRVLTAGGSVRFWYYPLRYQKIALKPAPKNYGQVLQNLDKTQVSQNGRTIAPTDQSTTGTVTSPDGRSLAVSVIAQRPDAGDGLGSNTPAKLSDITVYVPPVYGNARPGAEPKTWSIMLKMLRVESMGIFDLVSRTATYAANLSLSNFGGDYDGVFGRFACALDLWNGYSPWYRACTGIVGDSPWHTYRQDPVRLAFTTLNDKSVMLMRGLGEEIDFDGWPWPAVVRFVCNAGNIADDFLLSLPYAPPGAAMADSPFPTLGRGSGMTAAYRYYANQSCWSILCELVMQITIPDPTTGLPTPFYMGYDEFGQFHFEPISFINKAPTVFYSDRAAQTGGWPIEEHHIFNSVEDMRSSLFLWGLDANTFEVLILNRPLSPQVLEAVGYTVPLIQRSPTFVSSQYMSYISDAMAIQASIPQQTLRLKVPFLPWVKEGAVCDVWLEEIGGAGRYVIERLYSAVGIQDVSGRTGFNDCYSIADCRNVLNTL